MQQFDIKLGEFLRQNAIAHEKFTEMQLAKCLKEALLCGDFVMHVTQNGAQGIFYVPFVESESLRIKISKLEAFISKRLVFGCDKCKHTAQSSEFSEWGMTEGDSCGFNGCDGKMHWLAKP